MRASITDITEETITVWRPGKRTRRNRLRHWLRSVLAAVGIGRTRRRIKTGDVVWIDEGGE